MPGSVSGPGGGIPGSGSGAGGGIPGSGSGDGGTEQESRGKLFESSNLVSHI